MPDTKSLLALALRALHNSSALVFQDVAHAGLRDEAIAALEAAVSAGTELLPASHVAVPVELDEEFAKAVLVQHTVDEDDMVYAFEAWDFIVEEARRRQAAGLQSPQPACEGAAQAEPPLP